MLKKKKLLALLCALTFADAASSATVYDKDGTSLDLFGRIRVMAMNSHAAALENSDKGSPEGDSTISADSRFGLAGRSRICNGVYAIAMTEWDMATGDNDDSKTEARYQFVGIDAQQYGTLTFGRGDSAYYTVAGATDIYKYLDTRANDYYIFGDQVPGLVMYSLSAMGWDIRLSFQAPKDNINSTGFSVDSGGAFAVATRLDCGITIAYGASYQDFSYEGSSTEMLEFFGPMLAKSDLKFDEAYAAEYATTSKAPSYKVNKGIAISYGTLGQGFYGAFVYNVTRYKGLAHHLYTYELALDYAFYFGLGINGGYSVQRYDNDSLISDLNLGVYYKFNPCFQIFFEGQIDLNAEPERLYGSKYIADQHLGENKVVLGAEYDF